MPSLTGVVNRIKNTIKFGRFDHKNVFDHIFRNRYWGDFESVSGIGSRLAQTENIRMQLPILFNTYLIETLFDAPCGDLNWMRDVLNKTSINYIGGDIVPEVVRIAERNSPNPSFQFRVFDITSDDFPKADMWLCRDVLFHLSYSNIWKSLENFCRSEIPMMLVTTHTDNDIKNRNITTGDFRYINLLKPPFLLPEQMIIERIIDFNPPQPAREVILIRRIDLARHMKTIRF